MHDIVELLNDFKTRDHERLCQGREYVCSCGYDADLERAAVEAAEEITALRARADAAEAAEWKTKDCFWEIYEDYLSIGGKIRPSADMGENWKARAEAAEKERDAALVFKAKAISRGRLIERFRDHLMNMCDHVDDEGDRIYFGSTNDFHELREIAREMDGWKWHAIMAEKPERDPYADARAARKEANAAIKRAEAAEALLAEAKAVLEPFASRAARYADIPGIVMTSDNVELWQVASRTKADLTVGDLRAAAALVKKLEERP